jgi:2-amino-4-hydroxy-6-hydroxymethyldihydropteridine diphosphokinase
MGSNLGDRAATLRFALRGLRRLLDAPRPSAIFETAPRHLSEQPRFLNACCTGRTRLTPRQLLAELQHLETLAGRRAGGPRYGPRPLDLDLLLYGSAVIDEPGLTVPHPRMRERAFVLIPLTELIPDSAVPASGGAAEETVGELAARVDATGVERTNLEWEPEV